MPQWRFMENSDSSKPKNIDSSEDLRRELEAARARIAEQERQISLLAQDKRVFLDNMSRELCTPLDSILILSRLLEANPDNNLTARQVEFATVIGQASSDLLRLIKELLALAEATQNNPGKS